MERILQQTDDGSYTIAIPGMKVTYHSTYGALQESMHIFINAGLQPLLNRKEKIHVFEMGFGTGLNALLTLQQALKNQQKIYYTCIELYPLEEGMYTKLNYLQLLNDASLQAYFDKMHSCNWEEDIFIHPLFTFHKSNISLIDFSTDQQFNLVYFDAFDSAAQPELWTENIFQKIIFYAFAGRHACYLFQQRSCAESNAGCGFYSRKIKRPAGEKRNGKGNKALMRNKWHYIIQATDIRIMGR